MSDDAHFRGELPAPKPLPDRPFGGLIPVLETLATYEYNFTNRVPYRATGNEGGWYDRIEYLRKCLIRTPGFDRLVSLCREETGHDPDAEYVRKLTGRLSREQGRPLAEMEALSISEAMDLIDKPPPPDDQSQKALLEQTCRLLSRSVEKARLVRFLAEREGRKADMYTLAKEFYTHKCPTDNHKRTARRHAERTSDDLEAKNCPLRLVIDGNVAYLVDAQMTQT